MIITWMSSGGSSVSFSKSDPTYILLKDYEGFGTPEVSFKTVAAPYQDGATLLDTRFNTRKFSINLMVTGPTLTDIQTAVNTLIRLFNPGSGPGILEFLYEDGTAYYINCSGRVIPSASGRSNKHQLVKIDLTAHAPFFYTAAQVKTIGTAGTIMFNTDLTTNLKFPFTLPSNTANAIAVNGGDVAAGATIIIAGDVTNPKVSNTFGTTTQYFSFTKDMDVGDTMTITTHFGNKTVSYYDATAGTTVNGFQYLDADSTFFQIMPGDNSLAFTSSAVSAATRVSVTWSDQYSGV
jgi:hypothetical protein